MEVQVEGTDQNQTNKIHSIAQVSAFRLPILRPDVDALNIKNSS